MAFCRGGYQPPARKSLIGLAFPAFSRAFLCGRLIAAPTVDGGILLSSIHISMGASISSGSLFSKASLVPMHSAFIYALNGTLLPICICTLA